MKRGSDTAAARGQAPLPRTLHRRVEVLTTHLVDALDGDVDAVHESRVATRRLREIVPIVTVVRAGNKGARMMRRLKRLTRALGPLRELDVALAIHLERDSRRRTPGIVALRHQLRQARAEALERLRQACDRTRAERLLARLAKLEQRIQDASPAEARATAARARRRLAAGAVDRARALSDAVAASGAIFIAERVHAVRIAAKQLRYALELADELRLFRTGALVTSLRGVQDVLGELHDIEVLRAQADLVRAAAPLESPAAAELGRLSEAYTAEVRTLHAVYLRRARALVRLTDRVRDRVAPCLDPSIST